MTQFRLGLIGDNIAQSRAPALHRFCGGMAGLDLSYDLLIPTQMGMTFDAVFEHVQARGYHGLNITLPYKERVVAKLDIPDPMIARIGACNTVVFDAGGAAPRGFNTDYSGFLRAYRTAFGGVSPGRVVMFGAGGVGRAVGFALAELGAVEIVLIDADPVKATALAARISAAGGAARVGAAADLNAADGVINCTPLGMVGYGGSPVAEDEFPSCRWAFDAVYTPVDTPFKAQAVAAGAAFLSGYELYYWQGVDAFEIFTGRPVADHAKLRGMLAAG